MAYAYSTKDLGAGSIGGNGFWLIKDVDYPVHAMAVYGNTNLNLERALEDALVFDKNLPSILSQPSLEMRLSSYQTWQLPYNPPTVPAWTNLGAFAGSTLYAWAWASGYASLYLNRQRHAHRVLFENQQGDFVEDASRIPLGSSGYTDTLPGLFVIKPVAGTIVSGDYCYVTITPYSNPRVWWVNGSTRIHWDFEMSFDSAYHPYLRNAAQMVRADLSTGNHNLNIIPGVDIQFNTPLEGDSCIVSIGHEYQNAFSEEGVIGSINGMRAHYVPMSAKGVLPFGGGYEEQYWLRPSVTGTPPASRWHIYNVTGAAQTGCKFIIRPFVRLDQGNAIAPFDQWFMGYDSATALTPQSTPYTISFVNYVAGSPATVRLVFSEGGTSTTILEINPTTKVPTGVSHTNGEDLKCDGTTLYRWDALGIYFVLSPDLVVSQTASVCIRKGSGVERYIPDGYTPSNPYSPMTSPPISKTIGGWDGLYDAGSGLYYPASFACPESLRTGIIQTQGHDLAFFNSSVNALIQHWYNHYPTVATWMMPNPADYDNLNEYVVMAVCDDPRYFQVVPCTWVYVADRNTGIASQMEANTPGWAKSIGSANVSVPDTEYSMICSGSIHERKGGLVLRVNKLSSQLVSLMSDAGITLE